MEKSIFDSLISKEETLLKSLLILSINGVYISIDQLLNYFSRVNSIIVSSNQDSSDFIEKRYQMMKGLDIKQYNSLYDHFKSFYHKNNNFNEIININTLNNNSNSLEYHSFQIIIENNKNFPGNYGDNNFKINKKIKLIHEDDKHSSNNNKNNNNNNNNSMLFEKVWKNIYIKNNILFHLRLYNIHLNRKLYMTYDSLLNYKYSSYINSIEYDYNERENLSFGLLPSNLEELEFQYEFSATLYENSIPNTVKTIIFSESFNQALNKNIIPQSVTSIKLGDEFDQPFINKRSTNCKEEEDDDDDNDEGTVNKESWIPEGIKHLEFGNGFSQDIKISDQLYSKNSLKSLILEHDYGGVIEYGAIPNSVTTLSREFNSEMNSRDFNAKKDIGGSITSIQFDNCFNQVITPNQFSNNIFSIKFGNDFNQELHSPLETTVLPKNLTSLTMGSSYDKEFNENSLPKQLKVLILGNRFNRKLNKEMIPSTLESIKFGAKFNQTLPNDLFLHTNLKSLVLGSEYDKPFPLSAIPSKSITHLELSSIKGELPDLSSFHSLRSLDLGFFEKKIPIGHLPPNITSLTFGPKFKNISFEPNLLPNKLKKLIIKNQRFYQDQTTLSNSLPISLESIYISIENTEFINKLTSDFVSKFIRFY
ncbi:hypothetical protein ACTFIW_004334 [Dictyostelium discoideum]